MKGSRLASKMKRSSFRNFALNRGGVGPFQHCHISFPIYEIILISLLWNRDLAHKVYCGISSSGSADDTEARAVSARGLLAQIDAEFVYLLHFFTEVLGKINKISQKTIPRGYRNNYIPCWDAECESLYKTFLQSPQGDDSSLAATAVLAKLDRKRRDRWSEAVRSINFSHSSRKAWSILNNLTGRSRHSPRHCPVSANAIASQLVRNGKYEIREI